MKELNDVVTNKIGEMISNGTVEEIISNKLEETIIESVNNAMRTYSEFGKAITAKIEESIQCGAREIEIPAYNIFIQNVINEKFTEILQENAASHLAELIEKSIPPIEGNAKSSTLMDHIRHCWTEKAKENGNDEIEICQKFNDDGTSMEVTMTSPDGDDITVTFYNWRDNGWHIGYIREREHSITSSPTKVAATYMNDVTKRLFQYYAMQKKFEMDEQFESIDTYCY